MNPFHSSEAKPGEGCFHDNPRFANPQMLDFRLLPGSPCIGKASHGGDMGCPFTPEIMELCQAALKLRGQGIIQPQATTGK